MHELERRRSGLSGLGCRSPAELGHFWGRVPGAARWVPHSPGAARAWVRRSLEMVESGLAGGGGKGKREGKEEEKRE